MTSLVKYPSISEASAFQRSMEGFSAPEEFNPGILDLHAIDTELLSEASIPGFFESPSPFTPVVERGFENDLDAFASASKQQSNRPRMFLDATSVKNISLERERTSKDNVATKIKVVVRRRPLNKKELSKREEDIITIEPNCTALTVHETKLKVDLTAYVEKHEFVFDAVLDDHVTNDDVYRVTVEPIVPAIFQRTKATCFAYGQTGSGKTYTMQPLPLKASQDILSLMQQGYRNQGFQLWVSFFEIYGGKLYDLLNERRKLCMREDGKQQVCIVGLQEYMVSDVDTVKDYIEKGNATRSTGSTGANEESSRSHAILQLVIKRSPDGSDSKPGRMVGKLSFIDLAGSERGADTTDNDRQTRIEGAEINKSLLALKECIRALDSDQGHIPFRGSKLTEVLRDSFVGDSRTVMISCISPNSGSCEHTLNTLRYADRVKSLSKANSKKETFTAPQVLRESTSSPLTLPLLFPIPASSQSTLESNSSDLPSDRNRYGEQNGWHSQMDGESRTPFTMDQGPPSARDDGSSPYPKGHDSGTGQEAQEQDRFVALSRRKVKSERYRNPKEEVTKADAMTDKRQTATVHTNLRLKDIDSENNVLDPDEDLNTIMKEEEELVTAHRKQVEDTIDIVREEMKLLSEADQPGNGIDRYILRLNQILSQKVAGITSLQARLARFQRLLSEQAGVKHVAT